MLVQKNFHKSLKISKVKIGKIMQDHRSKVDVAFYNFNRTRRLVNVRSHMMFRPALIYIFELNVFWITFLTKR